MENLKNFLNSFQTLEVKIHKDKKILQVCLNRPKQLNALNDVVFEEIGKLFSNVYLILKHEDIRVIILTGNGKCFSSGLDLKSNVAKTLMEMNLDHNVDPGRKGFHFYSSLKNWQRNLLSIEKCELPVIAGVHGYCLGAGVSILSFVDYRIATVDARLSVREVDIGLTADLGALQKLAKISGKEGIVKRLSFTGEIFSGEEGFKYGIIEEVVEKQSELEGRLFYLAEQIAAKSPLAIWGIKRCINYARDNTIENSLDMVATLNSALIQTGDIPESITAILTKTKASLPKL